MNIIVCNDQRREPVPDGDGPIADTDRERVNMDCMLIKELRRRRHLVSMFDGYDSSGRNPIGDPHKGASALANRIAEFAAQGLVYDLHYFHSFTYGITMYRQLVALKAIPADARVVVYTRFVDSERFDQLVDMGVNPSMIIDRNTHRIDHIAELFQG